MFCAANINAANLLQQEVVKVKVTLLCRELYANYHAVHDTAVALEHFIPSSSHH